MMDNPWRSKCSSPWTPPPQFQAEETAPVPVPGTSGNQMEINRRHNFLPFAFHEAGLEEHTLIGKPVVSCNTGNMELGKSFLALLSGGHSFSLPSDFQGVSNFESPGASRRVSANASTTAVNSMNSGFSLDMASFSGYDTNKTTGNRVEHSYVTSEPLSTFSGSQVPTFQVNLQSADAPLHNLSSSKEVVQQDLGEGTGEAVLSLKKGWPVDTVPVNFKKNHNSTVRPSRVILSEAKYGHQERVSALSGKRPRVFCMGTSGQLLLSDTGLLGIVCFCHNLHMSVAKFCEHSGARAANPGDAVQLESGETIVQWRKMFFIMIGIRVPDDGNGWDWPEGISVFGGGMDRSHANILPNLTKNTNTFQSACINGFSRFDESLKNLVSDNRLLKERTAMEKLCNMIPNGQQRNPSEGSKPSIKSFMGYTHGACSFASNFISHTMEECPDRDSVPIMNIAAKGERNSGNCFVSEHIDLSASDGNQYSSNPCSKTMESFGVAPIINRCSISGDNFMDKNATSSNIELRLGQPSQCSPALGSSVSVAMRSQLLQAPFDLKKPHLSISPRMTEEAMQNLWHNSSSSSSLNRREWCHAPGSFNATDPSDHAQLKGDATKSALISQFHSNYKVSEGSLPSLATSRIGNKSEGIIPKVLNGESIPPNCSFTDFSGNMLNGMKEKSTGNVPDPCNRPGVEIDSRNVADSYSYAIVNPNGMMFHNRQMVEPRLCSASFGGQCSLRSSNLNDRKIHSPSQWPYAMMTSVSEMREFSQCRSGSCHGNGIHDIVSQRSVNAMPTVGSRLLSSTTPANQSLPNSNLASDSLSALKNKEPIDVSQHLVDEKMRSFALKNKVISSKQDHDTSLVMDFERGRHCCISMETQRKGISTPLHEANQVPYQSIERDASAVPLQSLHSCSNCYSNSILEKLGFFMGRNNCNCTTSVQGISSHFKEREVPCPPIHVYGIEEQSSLRTGRINNDARDQVDRRSCYQKERNICPSAMCSHAATSKLSPGNCIHRAERPFISCVEHIENAIGKSPLLFTSTCDQNHLSQGGRISSLGQYDGNRCILANNDFHSAQWKDVPRRLIRNADDNSVGSPLVALEDEETIKSQLIEGNAKANDATSRVAGCLREQQTSDFCSGMSAPAPTDVSVEVDNMESIGDAVAETKSMDIIDEGSRIEKCGSSDEAPVSRMWEEDLALTNKVDSIRLSSENLPNDSSHLTHDVKLMKISKMKKVKKQYLIPEMVKHAQEYRKLRKIEKRKRATKWKRLDASFSAAGCSTVYHDSMDFHTESHGALSEGMELILQPDNLEKRGLTSFTGNSGVKRKRSLLSLAKSISWKGCEELHRKDDDAQTQPNSNGLSIGKHKSPVGKNNKSTPDGTSLIWKDEVCEISGKIPKCSALDCLKSLSNTGGETFNKKMKPIVCGTMGIITNGNLGGKQKPPKIVSLRSILKTAKRCMIVEGEHVQPTILETKETCFCKNEKFCNECSNSKEKKDSIVLKNVGETGYLSMSMRSKACFNQNKGVDEQFAQKEMHDVSHEIGGPNNHHYAKKPKQKETRKRSLGELTGKSKHAKNMSCLPHLGERKHPQLREADFPLKQSTRKCSDDDSNDNNSNSIRFRARKFLKSVLQSDSMVCEKSFKSAKDIQERMTDLHQLYLKRNSMEVRRLEPVPLDSDAFCCVCGGSSNDEVNQLLKCNHCSIKVHQACYGVSKMPKGHWYCRPCKSNSKNIVCVLCGYEGGAMTKALRSHNIVKSLLKAWKVETGSTPMGPISLCESVCDELHTLDFVRGSTEIKEFSSSSIVKPTNVDKLADDVMKLHPLPHTEGLRICDSMSNKFQVYNTITAGVFDPSVMQWVHMVCGLWTPGTRCPNVDTMNAFDISGASPARKNIVCSMCNRPGGSCIRCRVVNCSIHFHPWCAHQKGLLQSENEGPDDESVGFYGRCMLHANSVIPTESCFTDNDLGSTQREEFTCARTEGYKGRKSEDGFSNTHCGRSGDGGGCLVPQEQINAWLHINGQKSCSRPIKSLDLDVEHDCRKEYSRYKQAKGWKKLVVYKSGIHALGLYTSQFISRGAMVVEYVGEIVGPRVADKREIEYQSGSKLQYKSACYFFRIDKEHIIDATRKGGIARFVNHSCLPNCVAKVVTVRNEKKVVFFAERDINPGEEITYDYHFNHEDEGKKIPCFCRSRNCRRYLN